MSEDELMSALIASESAKIEKIRKKYNESRHKFSKSKINEIRSNLYETENKKNLLTPRQERFKKILLALEKNRFKPKKYYEYDDTEYKEIRD